MCRNGPEVFFDILYRIYVPPCIFSFLLKSSLGGGDDGDKKGGGIVKKMLSVPILTPAETKISVLLSASVERFGVSRMRDFFKWQL